MNALRSWLITPIYVALFLAILLLFHIPLVLANLVSQRCMRRVLYLMNICVLGNLRLIAGVRFYTNTPYDLPTDRPLIIVANHQSMYDITLLVTQLNHHYPRFIAKRELARRIPSISFALRAMHAAIIDRGDQVQALAAIEELGKSIAQSNGTACIFPEGTRARDGRIKRLKPAGVLALLDAAPTALIVPVAIDGMWQVLQHNFLPVPYGVKVSFNVLEPIEPSSMPREEITRAIQARICRALGQPEPISEYKAQRLIKS